MAGAKLASPPIQIILGVVTSPLALLLDFDCDPGCSRRIVSVVRRACVCLRRVVDPPR